MWQEEGRIMYENDILREFMGHNFVSGLRTLKLKKLKKTFKTKKSLKPKNLKPKNYCLNNL